MKTSAIIVLTILVLIVGFSSGYFVARDKYINKVQSSSQITETKIDTLIINKESIKIKTIPEIRYITKYDTTIFRDSFYITRPFIAELDTIIKRDTLNVQYIFPLNQFNVGMRFGPDSVYQKEITIFRTEIKEEAWYIKPLYLIGGASLGYIFGRL